MFTDLLWSPRDWAVRHFGDLDLGDRRRTSRAIVVAEAMAKRPAASLPTQMGDAHQAKAAYRFFDTPGHVTFESLAGDHWRQTRLGMRELKTVLLLGDTTEIDFSDHPDVSGLEPIGNGKGRGMNLHTVLAVDPGKHGQVQGVAWQDLFYRQQVDPTESAAERASRTDRQSRVWARSVQGCGAPATGCRFVHVCDCGSDDFGFFTAAKTTGVDFLGRIYRDRQAAAGHESSTGEASVLDLARSLPAMGGKTLSLRSRKRVKKKMKVPGQKRAGTFTRDVPARQAELLLSAGPVSLFPPASGPYPPEPLRLWVVRVWEPNPAEGVEPIEWILLSSLPVTDLSDALLMAQWYGYRWLIEEYHKCLKTGCRIEQRQLETSDRLEALLGINVVLAARLLAIKQQTLDNPATPAAATVDELTVKILIARRKLKTPPQQLTVYDFWRHVAKLGGFLGRKSDGEPGWQTTWLGWCELSTLVDGARLLSSLDRGT